MLYTPVLKGTGERLRLTPRQLKAIKNVIEYLFNDEQKYWEESDKPKRGHIFNDVLELAKI